MKPTQDRAPNRPTHEVWQVIGDDKDARWNRIGAAWAHKDGQGLNLKLEAMPLTGRIVVRVRSEDESAGGQQ